MPVLADAPVDEEWVAFEAVVSASWRAYQNSGYALHLRGPNHDRAYRIPMSITLRLQSARGTIFVNGVQYTIAPSLTTAVALHRALTAAQGLSDTVKSFVFHL